MPSQGKKGMERLNGLEPSTFSLGSWGSWKGHHVLIGDRSRGTFEVPDGHEVTIGDIRGRTT